MEDKSLIEDLLENSAMFKEIMSIAKRCDEIVEEAHRKAKEIVRKAEREAEKRRHEILAQARVEAERVVREAEREARVEASRIIEEAHRKAEEQRKLAKERIPKIRKYLVKITLAIEGGLGHEGGNPVR